MANAYRRRTRERPLQVELRVNNWCTDGTANVLIGATPRLSPCKKGQWQKLFAIAHHWDKYVSLVNVHSRMCMDVSKASKNDNAQVILWNCHYNPNQQWEILGSIKSKFQLKNRNSGKCLTLMNRGQFFTDTWRYNQALAAKKNAEKIARMNLDAIKIPPDPSKNLKAYYTYKGGNEYVQVACGKYPVTQKFNIKGWSR